MNIVLYPRPKINIGLRVTARRNDGYHDIETLFFPVDNWREDILEIIEADSVSMNYYGTPFELPGRDIEKELCVKAYRLLQREFGLPPVGIYLCKNIPVGAGMGGGSSDAAWTLRGLNELFGLGLSDGRLAEYAARLGSDCPFFIYSRPMYGSGRGEVLTPDPSGRGLSDLLETPSRSKNGRTVSSTTSKAPSSPDTPPSPASSSPSTTKAPSTPP